MDYTTWYKYYSGIHEFVMNNCANIRTTRLILRTVNPYYPNNGGATGNFQMFTPTTSSPLYTGLLSRLPGNVEVKFYPYIMEDTDREFWATYAGTNDPLEGVFVFVRDWQNFLKSVNAPVTVSGFVCDGEELVKTTKYSVSTSASHMLPLQAQYPGVTFGLALGFDAVGRMNTYIASGVVNGGVYLEFYDFYYPKPRVDSSLESPFLLNVNNATAMVEIVANHMVTSDIWTAIQVATANYPDMPIYPMWSIQNIEKTSCIFPLGNQCGLNYEFGNWSPVAFNQFIQQINVAVPALQPLQHGIFQYNFMPFSWVNADMAVCGGTTC